MRATINDIARIAGVSSATVDRVLNTRPGVSARTRNAVLQVAKRLEYFGPSDQPHNQQQDQPGDDSAPPVRLDFVLPGGTNAFIAKLAREIENLAAPDPSISVRVQSVEGFNPETLARALHGLKGKTDGIGVIALDHPAVSEAIRTLSASGIKVATMVSDIHHVPRIGYVGIDNRAAGRLAGFLLGRFLSENGFHKVALFAGSLSYRGHEEREMGFRHIISEEYGNIEILELREVRDDRVKAHREARTLLRNHPDLAAIYNIGAGTSGIARALKEDGRGKSVVFVGHDLTRNNKASLLDGTLDALIDQNPRVEAREALALLSSGVKNRPFVAHPPRLQVIFRENIPHGTDRTDRTDPS